MTEGEVVMGEMHDSRYSPVMPLHYQPKAESIGLRICKNCLQVKAHKAYKGSGKVCRACKGGSDDC